MLIRITGPTTVLDTDHNEVTDPDILRSLDGFTYDDDIFTNYLGGPDDETALAVLLEHGGVIRFEFFPESGELVVVTEYHAARRLTAEELNLLTEYTIGQWCDGIVEGLAAECVDRCGYAIDIRSIDGTAEQIDDGRVVTGRRANLLFTAAQSGDVAAIRRALANGEYVDETLAGETPLQYAASFGHADVMLVLIENGADVNCKDLMGSTPLQTCSGTLNDDDALRVVRALLERGADVNDGDGMGRTALESARWKGNTKLKELLIANGAT